MSSRRTDRHSNTAATLGRAAVTAGTALLWGQCAVKVTTPDLVKFKKLQRRLAEPMRSVVGILELLWRATALQAPRGDIGKFDNEDIAVLCDWDGDPDQLIEALVASGWLDRCTIHRLVVHDWAEHAPTFVRGVLAKKKLDFVKGAAAQPATKDASSCREQSTIDATIDATKDGSKDASSGHEQSTTMSCLVLPCHVMPSDGKTAPTESSPIVPDDFEEFIFPTKSGADWKLPLSEYQELRKAFPALDIDTELRKASLWLRRNPARQKSNVSRFLVNWLSKAATDALNKSPPKKSNQELVEDYKRHLIAQGTFDAE